MHEKKAPSMRSMNRAVATARLLADHERAGMNAVIQLDLTPNMAGPSRGARWGSRCTDLPRAAPSKHGSLLLASSGAP